MEVSRQHSISALDSTIFPSTMAHYNMFPFLGSRMVDMRLFDFGLVKELKAKDLVEPPDGKLTFVFLARKMSHTARSNRQQYIFRFV